MNTQRVIFGSLFALVILAGTQAVASDVKTVSLCAYPTLRYSQTKIDAHPGQEIVLTFKNETYLPKTAMAHDWVLLKAGTDSKAFAKAALTAKCDNFIPKSMASRVLVSIPMLGPQETRTIKFAAPKIPGKYPFLCSCPGHSGGGMTGFLIVK